MKHFFQGILLIFNLVFLACNPDNNETPINQPKINIDSLNDLHFVRLQNKQPKYTNSLSIHRHIICGGIINLVNLYNSIRHPNIKIISFNTDCIFVKTNLFILDNNLNKFLFSANTIPSATSGTALTYNYTHV